MGPTIRFIDKIIFDLLNAIPDPFQSLLRPPVLIYLSLSFLPYVFFDLVTGATPPSAVYSWSAFKDAWFARFWLYFGPLSLDRAGGAVRPLLTHASGVVLDIGSGQGHFLSLYDNSPTSKVRKIYSIELNRDHWPALQSNAEKAGLVQAGRFEIKNARIEELELKGGIQRGSVDTIVTLQTLCSMPQSDLLIPELRTYLKPGGKWIMYEHVGHDPSSQNWRESGLGMYQRVLDWVWPECFNGCSLRRPTKKIIEKTGGWKLNDVGRAPEDSVWSVIPTMKGVLVSE